MIEPTLMDGLLKQVIAEREPWIWRSVRERISTGHRRFERLVDWVIREYSDASKRRWYDPLHIAYSTSFALDLVEAGEADEWLLPGILLHDMGYFAITDKDAWNRPDVRVTHMQEGAAIAAEVLSQHCFAPHEIGHVVGLVATHDNPYLGYALTDVRRLALRDCDRVWVMHLVSFYKDWSNKKPPDPNCDVRRLLAIRRVHFWGVAAAQADARWGVDAEIAAEGAGRVEVPYLSTTRTKIDRLFERRRGELNDQRLWEDGGAFLEYVRQAIVDE